MPSEYEYNGGAEYDLGFVYTDDDDECENATGFNINDVPKHKRKKWKRLQGLNKGTHNGMWRHEEVFQANDRMNIITAISSYLQLTPYQRQEAARIFMREVDHEEMGVRAELVAIAVCAVVCTVDGSRYYLTDDLFKTILGRYDFSTKALKSRFREVRSQIRPPYGTEDMPESVPQEGRVATDGGGHPADNHAVGQRWDF